MKRLFWIVALTLVASGCVTTDGGKPLDQKVSDWLSSMKPQTDASKNNQKTQTQTTENQTETTTPTDTTPAPSADTATEQKTVLEKGSRRISIQVNLPEDNDFVKAFTTAKEAGLQDVILSQDWPDYETGKNEFNLS